MKESDLQAADITNFMDQVSMAIASSDNNEFPSIEVDRKICEHYNRERIKGFDEAGYFIFHGVKVYEAGKRGEADRRDALTTEDICHRGAKR